MQTLTMPLSRRLTRTHTRWPTLRHKNVHTHTHTHTPSHVHSVPRQTSIHHSNKHISYLNIINTKSCIKPCVITFTKSFLSITSEFTKKSRSIVSLRFIFYYTCTHQPGVKRLCFYVSLKGFKDFSHKRKKRGKVLRVCVCVWALQNNTISTK